MNCLPVALLALSLPAAGQLQSTVRKVPGDFPDLGAAVDGANPGDVLLVAPGTHVQPLRIDTPLSLVADGGTVRVEAPVTVTGIPAGAKVHLRGLEIEHWGGLHLLDNPGHVWVEGCTVIAAREVWSVANNGVAIRATGCDDVVLVDTRAFGADQGNEDHLLGQGLRVFDSTVHAYHCEFEGGSAVEAGLDTQWGADGVSVADAGGASEVLLSGCTARGGDGACFIDICYGANGSGLLVASGAVYAAGSTFVAGVLPPGGIWCQCTTTRPATDGPYTPFTGTPVSVSAGAPRREGELLTLTFEGPPALPVWYGTSVSSRSELMPAFRGSSLLGTLLDARFAGTLDATGRVDVQTPVPAIVAAGSGIRLFVQAFSTGPAILGGGSLVLLLDQSL